MDEGLKLLVSEIDPAKMHNITTLMVDLHSMFLLAWVIIHTTI